MNSSRVNLGKGRSQVTAPSVGSDKYVRLKHNFCPLLQYSASNRDYQQICRLQPVIDLCDLVTVVPMIGPSRHWVIPWDHRIAMGLSHHVGMLHHHETSLLLIVIGDECKSEKKQASQRRQCHEQEKG